MLFRSQALALDVKVLTENKEEIGIKELMDDDPVLYDAEPTPKHYDASLFNDGDDMDDGDVLGGLEGDDEPTEQDGGEGDLFGDDVEFDDPFDDVSFDDDDYDDGSDD